jgi:hypothetical protein
MDVTDTKLLEKCCSKCGEIKIEIMFIPKRNICKECRNKNNREKYKILEINENLLDKCNICKTLKSMSSFIKKRKICKDCNNNKRRTLYLNDEEHRKKLIQISSNFKRKKNLDNNKQKEEISTDNKKCSCCNCIKHKSLFRYNRLKCKGCERDEPLDKLKRVIRSRIISTLKHKNKNTIEYLGCNTFEYLNWLLNNDVRYTLENRGSEWHIDHVIPLSQFNLKDEQQQLIAFNWRNTMPLSVKENLSKNNKIIKTQVEQHYKKLVDYHLENKLELPQVFIDLFAKHLDAGSPLEPSIPLTIGNICEELG